MQLGLLLLFCGAALSVSTSIQHVRHAKVKRNPQAQKAQKALQAEKSVKRTWKSVGSNTECKGAGEVYREKSPGKLSNLEECKKSCQNEAGCQSITYFHDGWCSHFSTACTKTNWIDKAIAMQLSSAQVKRNPQAQKAQKALQAEKKPEDGDDDEDDTTAEPENGDDEPDPPPADDGVKRTWKLVGSNTECKGAGEVYRVQSPGKLPNLEECKKSCQNEAGCQSITYFQSGWCSHFSTACTKTKWIDKAIAMQLSSASGAKLQVELYDPNYFAKNQNHLERGLLEFGLHIYAKQGVKISGKKLQKDWITKGCGDAGNECECTFTKDPQKDLYSFTMRGRQTGGFFWTRWQLKFACKEVRFRLQSTGQTCKCDFTVRIDQAGWKRTFDDKCVPQYCLQDHYAIHGGGAPDPQNKTQLTATYFSPQKRFRYLAQCDEKSYCDSWQGFKRGFENRNSVWNERYKFGVQGGEGRGFFATNHGTKWFFGLVFGGKGAPGSQPVLGNVLDGSWVPSSSGGQASFSESMHWDKSSEEGSTSEVNAALSVSVEASYGGCGAGMEASVGWSSAASKTNADTQGGNSDRTCAAFQCEGGTTWQWQMELRSPAFKTKFDNCLFVCTPNQGTMPKCPFGSCCSSEDRLNECGTCSRRWCDPEDEKCPFNPAHPNHESYCGIVDTDYTNFLKMVRSRVVIKSRVKERQDYDFAELQEELKIKVDANDMLQNAFRTWQQSNAVTNDKKHVELREKVQAKLSELGKEVMEMKAEEVEQYLDVALEQAKDFDHEKGVMKLSGSMQDDPCAARKGARPGDPFWCLCNKHGHKIEWEEGDSPAAEAVLEGPKKGNATNGASVDDRAEIALFHSRCNNKKEPKSFRHKSCHWQGNATHGGCCSKKEGCTHDVTPDLDRAYYKLRDYDLGPDDFSLEQLIQADERLRMECYYKVETDLEATNRIRATHGLKALDITEPTDKERARIRDKERDNLFLCFRKYFLDHEQDKFNLQNIDHMLVTETTSCEERLVNRKCIKKRHEDAKPNKLKLKGGGKKKTKSGVSGAVETKGNEGGEGLSVEEGSGSGSGEGSGSGSGEGKQESRTKDSDAMQKSDTKKDGVQDGEEFEKEQDDVQASRQAGKLCCKVKGGNEKPIFMNGTRGQCPTGKVLVNQNRCKSKQA